MKKFRALDSMHNRNVAQRKQFVVILNKIPEFPNQTVTLIMCLTVRQPQMYYAISHYAIGDCKVFSFHFVLRSLTTII